MINDWVQKFKALSDNTPVEMKIYEADKTIKNKTLGPLNP